MHTKVDGGLSLRIGVWGLSVASLPVIGACGLVSDLFGRGIGEVAVSDGPLLRICRRQCHAFCVHLPSPACGRKEVRKSMPATDLATLFVWQLLDRKKASKAPGNRLNTCKQSRTNVNQSRLATLELFRTFYFCRETTRVLSHSAEQARITASGTRAQRL